MCYHSIDNVKGGLTVRLTGGSVFLDGAFARTDLIVREGRVAGFDLPDDGPAIDCRDALILPGLVDIHTHGCAGFDFATADDAGLRAMLRRYASRGVTDVVATLVTMSPADIREAVRRIGAHAAAPDEARIRGVRLEGPFLSKEKKGAHDESLLLKPDADFVLSLGDAVTVVDAAPELPGFFELVERFPGTVSVAHTACDYDTAMRAVAHGADHFTHLLNAMNQPSSRAPGCLGAFADSRAVAEVICDGIHIHPAMLRLLFSIGAGRVAVISDSMAAEGLPDGSYALGALPVTVHAGRATLADGTLAGSICSVADAAGRLADFGIPAPQIAAALTSVPANALRPALPCGRIAVGESADLAVFDARFRLKRAMRAGSFLPAVPEA